MRKVNFCIAVLFVLLTCQIYAENKVNIRIIQNDLTSTNIEVNENVKHLTFAGPEIRSITNIEGLEKLKSLESLDFYNLTFNNMDFFNSCKNLKELWISGCTITSFSFIEKITKLEKIELDFYIDSSNNELVKEKTIDLKQVKNLKRIYFSGLIKEKNQIKKYKTIPQFQNVPPECVLIMEDQGIENLSDIDISILKQFKYVDLTANPVLNTKDIKLIENGERCSSLKYEKIIKQVSSYNWYQNMDDANKSLQLLEEAIKIGPHKWDAYFQEIQIYATWEHKSENFVSNQEAVKEVYDRWINNGNEFNEIQQFCYANTLTSLGQIKQANPIYYELFNKFRIKNLEEISSEEFFIYVMCGIMIDEITMNNYDEFIKNHNEYEIYKEVLPQEFDEINKYGKESLAKRYCAK